MEAAWSTAVPAAAPAHMRGSPHGVPASASAMTTPTPTTVATASAMATRQARCGGKEQRCRTQCGQGHE